MKRTQAIKGVNLGGWLVLEPWMTPSLFKDSGAADEFSFCDTVSPARTKQLKEFRKRWVTEDDFKWLQANGIGAVRIPVGYWLFGDQPPFVGTVDFLDKAFAWARKHDIKVLVCLHGAPGSQNGNDHSGQAGGVVGWGDETSVAKTMEVLRKLVARYQDDAALLGFELLNEPSPSIGKARLRKYYRQAYKLIRRQCAPGTWVVISDCFQLARWSFAMHWPWYRDVYLDTHQYQVFTDHDKELDITGHMEKTARVGRKLRWLGRHRRYIVGEWSAALDPRSLQGMDDAGAEQARRSYMVAQLAAYDQADAWFYWNYRTEAADAWSYRDMMRGEHDQGQDRR